MSQFATALLIRPLPHLMEGPYGYLLRLAESNWLEYKDMAELGIVYEPMVLQKQGLLGSWSDDPVLYSQVEKLSTLLRQRTKIWNHQFVRFCPHCLSEDPYWRVGWEFVFHDACPEHGIWLIDHCSACGKKLLWRRSSITRCQCGADLRSEKSTECPEAVRKISEILIRKLQDCKDDFAKPIKETSLEETQRLIRYLGAYMDPIMQKNPMKMLHVNRISNSWTITSLAGEVLSGWPASFEYSLEKIKRDVNQSEERQLGSVFGRAYHYLYKELDEKVFDDVREAFEFWLSENWTGGLAKRNSRLAGWILKSAKWIPINLAAEELGSSYQRLIHLINEGVIEAKTHVSKKDRKFVMVRRDQLINARKALDDSIDLKEAGSMLGVGKKRMREIVTNIFFNVGRRGGQANVPWGVSLSEVQKLLAFSDGLERVFIPDEGCVSLNHIFRYWAWSYTDFVRLIDGVRTNKIRVIQYLDGHKGISGWVLNEQEIKGFRELAYEGHGEWLTVVNLSKLLGVNQHAGYGLVRNQLIKAESLHGQPRGGVRIRSSELEAFKNKYIFSTAIAQELGTSPRKTMLVLADYGIRPISGPNIDDGRQIVYQRTEKLQKLLETLISKKDDDFKLV